MPERIVVFAPSWIGDLVMATASFRDLRSAFPESRIVALVKPGRDRVLRGGGAFDEILTHDPSNRPGRILQLARQLRERRFELAILYPDAFRTRLVARLARIPRRLGYARNFRGLLLTDPVAYPGPRGAKIPEPMPLRYQRLLSAIGVPPGDTRPVLAVTREEEDALATRLRELGVQSGERLIGFNPGASFGASKIWPPERFAKLGDLLAERHGARVILLVGPGEEAIARDIERRMKTSPVSTAGNRVPLDELKPLVRDLLLLVTTDTGPRHYATAFGVPRVVLMGPTDRRYTDIDLDRSIVVQKDFPCVPCHLKTCPIDHRCMRAIEPEEVLQHVETLDRDFGVFERAQERD